MIGTGLLYYRARYYAPKLEVFISPDPLGDAQRYVGGNPMSFVEPLGLRPDLNWIPNDGTIDPKLRQWADNSIPDNPNTYTIAAHGNPVYIWNPKRLPIMPYQLAQTILNDKNYKAGQPIVLYSCSTGMYNNSFAQILSDLTGSPVYAPNEKLWWDNNGPNGIYPAIHVPSFIPGIGNSKIKAFWAPGKFLLFTPRN